MSNEFGELVRQRDSLISQIEGEWTIDADARAIHKLAVRAAVLTVITASIFMMILMLIASLMKNAQGSGAGTGIWDVVLVFGGFMLIVASVVFVVVELHGVWYRRLNPMVISGNQLIWNKRKGYVPERMDLHKLTEVMGFTGAGVQGGGLLVWIAKKIDPSGFISISPCVFIAQGEHNPPKFSPGIFRDGLRLISVLEQIASINSQLIAIKNP